MPTIGPFFLLGTVFTVRLVFLMNSLSPNERYLISSIFFSDNPSTSFESNDCPASDPDIDLRYSNPAMHTRGNRSFDKRWIKYLCHFGLLESQRPIASLPPSQSPPPVLVTAFSENHFLDGLQFLLHLNATLAKENVQNVTLYLYDLGLGRVRSKQIRRSFGHFVQIRSFPFHRYPSYVAILKQYRWKPLVVADVLRTHASLWWMDSSVRIKSLKELHSYYYSQLLNSTGRSSATTYPLLFQTDSSHSIYAATSATMYDYFPIDRRDAIRTSMFGATVFLLIGSGFGGDRRQFDDDSDRTVLSDVIRWWVLCALEKDCMAPRGHALHCQFARNPDDRYGTFAQCHRYDQSALNILVANANRYAIERFMRPTKAIEIDKLQ